MTPNYVDQIVCCGLAVVREIGPTEALIAWVPWMRRLCDAAVYRPSSTPTPQYGFARCGIEFAGFYALSAGRLACRQGQPYGRKFLRRTEERLHFRTVSATKMQARQALIRSVEGFCHPRRRKSALDYRAPKGHPLPLQAARQRGLKINPSPVSEIFAADQSGRQRVRLLTIGGDRRVGPFGYGVVVLRLRESCLLRSMLQLV